MILTESNIRIKQQKPYTPFEDVDVDLLSSKANEGLSYNQLARTLNISICTLRKKVLKNYPDIHKNLIENGQKRQNKWGKNNV